MRIVKIEAECPYPEFILACVLTGIIIIAGLITSFAWGYGIGDTPSSAGKIAQLGYWTANNTGDFVCVNIKGMTIDSAISTCKHEVGHEIFARTCENDFSKCGNISENIETSF